MQVEMLPGYVLPYPRLSLICNSIQQGPLSAVIDIQVVKQFPKYYGTKMLITAISNLTQINSVHNLSPYSFQINFNIILLSIAMLLNAIFFSYHARYMFRPSHLP
jgi:hypothetical protein